MLGARLRWTARFVLGLLLLGAIATAGWNAWQLYSNPLVGITVERTTEEIEIQLDRLLASKATASAMAERLRGLLAANPREWARIDAILELAAARGMTLPADVTAEIEAAYAEDYAIAAIAVACAKCLWDLDDCSFATVFICRVPIELTSVGDAVSVTRELTHMARGEEVDEIDLVLSTVGLGAVVIAPLVGGSSLSIKVGASLTKTAYRMGSLTAPVLAAGTVAARRAIDWDLLMKSRPGRLLDDLRTAVRPAELRPITDFLRSVDSVRGAIGARWTLFVLRKVDSPADVRKVAAVAEAGKGKTAGALEMLGMKRLLRLSLRWSDEIYALVQATVAAAVAIALLPLSLGKTYAIRRLRRWARGPDATRRRHSWKPWRRPPRAEPRPALGVTGKAGEEQDSVAPADAGGNDPVSSLGAGR